MRLLSKNELEKLARWDVLDQGYQEAGLSRIYQVDNLWVETALSKIDGVKIVQTLGELEQAMGDADCEEVFIPANAAVTSKGLKQILERAPLGKIIYTAFEISVE